MSEKGFYSLPKNERAELVAQIQQTVSAEINANHLVKTLAYFSDEDTYIRKLAYLSVGRIYFSEKNLQPKIMAVLKNLFGETDFRIRQTVVNAAGEIGMKDFFVVEMFFEKGLIDSHHSVRNAVIGSVKKMGEKNAKPVLAWAKKYLHHENKEIRREICHGIELRGRKFPQDILPLLRELQWDKTARVRNTLIHVIGQIAYKKNCLETVCADLKHWENKQLVAEALEEIIDVHYRYRNFAVKTQEEARKIILDFGF